MPVDSLELCKGSWFDCHLGCRRNWSSPAIVRIRRSKRNTPRMVSQSTKDNVMNSTSPTAFDGDVDGSKPQHSRTDKDEASLTKQAVVTVPPHDGGNHIAALTGTFDGRTIQDEEYCATEGFSRSTCDQTDDLAKLALRKTKRARTFHVIGLAFEVLATLLAFQQSVSAGALEIADCSFHSRLSEAYISLRAVENCNGPVEAFARSAFQFGVSFDEHTFDENALEEHVGCDARTAVTTGDDTFEKRCNCCFFHDGSDYPACSWVPLLDPLNGICYAQGVLTNTSDETMLWAFSDFSAQKCWPKHPPGTAMLTIMALVVALSSQLVEAFVGIKYWRYNESKTGPTLAASIFEALGVLAVSTVLLALPGFYNASEYVSKRIPTFYILAWTTVIIVIVGALAEIAAACSDRAVRRLPRLGVVGNGFVWLGAAVLEMVVATYLLWTGNGVRNVTGLLREAAGLFTLELLGLVLMWIARGLWMSAKNFGRR